MKNICEWLNMQLADDGLYLVDDIRDKAKQEGISRKELKEARKILGVKTFHQFDEYGDTGNYFWYLERQ